MEGKPVLRACAALLMAIAGPQTTTVALAANRSLVDAPEAPR